MATNVMNSTTDSQILGMGMENCIPNFWEREREWKLIPKLWEWEWEAGIPGNGREQKFPLTLQWTQDMILYV